MNPLSRVFRLLGSLSVAVLLLGACGGPGESQSGPTEQLDGIVADMAASTFPTLDVPAPPAEASALLQSASTADDVLSGYLALGNGDCVAIGESLGARAGSSETPAALLKLVTRSESYCSGAYARGVYRGMFAGKKFVELEKAAAGACVGYNDSQEWVCSFNLGRALVASQPTQPLRAAEACSALDAGSGAAGEHMTFKRSCLSGMWSGFFGDARVLSRLKELDADVPMTMEFCLGSEGDSRDVCLQEIYPTFWGAGVDTDINPLFAFCGDMTDANLADQCYFGMGRGVSVSRQNSPAGSFSGCQQLGSTRDRDYCLIAAGEAFEAARLQADSASICVSAASVDGSSCMADLGRSAFGLAGGSIDKARELCASMFTSTPERQTCTEGAWSARARIGFVHFSGQQPDAVFAGCTNVSAGDAASCIRTALTGVGDRFEALGGAPAFLKACDRLAGELRKDCIAAVTAPLRD